MAKNIRTARKSIREFTDDEIEQVIKLLAEKPYGILVEMLEAELLLDQQRVFSFVTNGETALLEIGRIQGEATVVRRLGETFQKGLEAELAGRTDLKTDFESI